MSTSPTVESLEAAASPPLAPARARLPALDWMRGLVMILMAIDHASGAFNAGRLFSDSARMYQHGSVLPAAQFLTRWMTHLCAPTFVFLAGASAALSVERRRRDKESSRSLDRYLIQRGLIIAALDPLWMTWGFTGGRPILFQVLYAIGLSLAAMALLRRLPQAWLIGGSLGLFIGGEALTGRVLALFGSDDPPLPVTLLLTGGRLSNLIVAYPVIPWLAIMMLGWAFGRSLALDAAARPERLLAGAGLMGLATFVLVRGANGYGNMLLLRDDSSLVQWLHVSKYPPGLSYYTLELGLMALALCLFFRLARGASALPGLRPLRVLGQTAFFFYLLHVHVLEAFAAALGLEGKLGLASAYGFGLAIVVVLYPACVRYLAYKRAHPDGWTRYL